MHGWMHGSFLIYSHMHSCWDRRQSHNLVSGTKFCFWKQRADTHATRARSRLPVEAVHTCTRHLNDADVHDRPPCAKTRCSVFPAPVTHADLLLSHTLVLAPVTGLPIGWLGLMAALCCPCYLRLIGGLVTHDTVTHFLPALQQRNSNVKSGKTWSPNLKKHFLKIIVSIVSANLFYSLFNSQVEICGDICSTVTTVIGADGFLPHHV